jgi:hypothetical protein
MADFNFESKQKMTKGIKMYLILAQVGLKGHRRNSPIFPKNLCLGGLSVLKLYFKAYLMADFGFESK